MFTSSRKASDRGVPRKRRKLRQPSKIVDVVLPRPLGIVFEEDARRQRVVVESFIPGSHADKLAKVSAYTVLLSDNGRCLCRVCLSAWGATDLLRNYLLRWRR